MKCLLVSDLHYTLPQFDWLLSVAQNYDVVIVAGDHLDTASAVDARVQITVILTYLKQLQSKTRLIVSSGNHDLDTRNADGERVARWISKVRALGISTDCDTIEIGSTLITICPWWDGPQAKEQVRAQLQRDADRPKARWIWVYHAPPADSPTCWDGKQAWGDADLTGWIAQYQPDMVLTGHIHQSPFRAGGAWVDRMGKSWVFNSGRQIGPCPTHTVFDTNEETALWFSLAGDRVVRLNEPLPNPVPELTELPAWLT